MCSDHCIWDNYKCDSTVGQLDDAHCGSNLGWCRQYCSHGNYQLDCIASIIVCKYTHISESCDICAFLSYLHIPSEYPAGCW